MRATLALNGLIKNCCPQISSGFDTELMRANFFQQFREIKSITNLEKIVLIG